MSNTQATPTTMTLMDHIRELRRRLFIVALVFLAGSLLAYTLRAPVIRILLSPLKGQKLVYLNVAGGFNFVFVISLYLGIAFAAPVLIQQLYGFVRPVLPERIQKYSVRIFFASLGLLTAGVLFGYFCAIPGALNFLYTFADNYVSASLTADSYLSFIISYTLGLGVVFQVPLVLLFIHWIKPLTPGGLLRSERWVILLAFVAAAFITPTPDPINQTVMALPIIAVYQIGVIAVLISISNHKKQTVAAVREAPVLREAAPTAFIHPRPVHQSTSLRQTKPILASSTSARLASTTMGRAVFIDGVMKRSTLARHPSSLARPAAMKSSTACNHVRAQFGSNHTPRTKVLDGILPPAMAR